MRNQSRLSIAVILLWLAAAGHARAEERSLVILFGPTAEDSGRAAVQALAGTAHEWLKSEGAAIELRRPGISEGQELTRHIQTKDLERTFLDAAAAGRQTDLPGFLNALDKAAYALARRGGKRLLITVVESPPPAALASIKGGPEEFDNRLAQTIEFCRSNSENVIVVDSSGPASKEPLPALKSLAAATGGMLVRDPKTLDASVLIVAPVPKAGSEVVGSAPPVPPPKGLRVQTRFIRTLPARTKNLTSDLGPTNGLLLVECPFDALQFRAEGGRYAVQARVTETVRNAEGKPVWEAGKEISLKEPLKKQDVRRAGSLFYMRELQLPGGQYTIEATVEDLLAGKTGTISRALKAGDSLPGLGMSDALFVRPFNNSADRFEADQVLSYDAKALSPILDPVFQAGREFDLQLYFVIYPDLRGAQPEISLEILRNGQAVGRSQLPFNDRIRNTTGEGQALDAKGEQKHEFPYLASILKASFDAGQYEARVTVRQGRSTITGAVPFRVARSMETR